jgi:hypothetical protein
MELIPECRCGAFIEHQARGVAMSGKTTSWISFTAQPLLLAFLLLAFLLLSFWRPTPDFETLLQVVVCTAAGAAAFQFGEQGRYLWAAGFAAMAVVFNPLVPVTSSLSGLPWTGFAGAAMFLIALVLLKRSAPVPIASITDAIKRSESVEAVWAWKH